MGLKSLKQKGAQVPRNLPPTRATASERVRHSQTLPSGR